MLQTHQAARRAAGRQPRAAAGPSVPRPDPPMPATSSAALARTGSPATPTASSAATTISREIRTAGGLPPPGPDRRLRPPRALHRPGPPGRHAALFGAGTEVLMFAMTSGTTNRPKTIPSPAKSLSDYREGWTIWGIQAFDAHPEMLANGLRPILQIASDWRESFTPGGHPLRGDHRPDGLDAEPAGPHHLLHAGLRLADQGHRVEVLRRAAVLGPPRPGHDHRRQSRARSWRWPGWATARRRP